jgi:hypothetical protein
MAAFQATQVAGAGILAVLSLASPAFGALTISSAATQDMSCSAGVCAPTATDAVLNATDLENLLASGNLTVTTTGSGGVQAGDIEVEARFDWSGASGLVLDAYRSIAIDKAISVDGLSSLSILTDDGGSGGTLSFGRKGNIAFANLSSRLAINGTSYTLVDKVARLASAVAADPSGTYAFANSYDAEKDGTYTQSPIPTTFEGTLEGLGNTISNVTIADTQSGGYGGFFSEIDTPATVRDLRLEDVGISGVAGDVGGLAGRSYGTAYGDSVSGTIEADRGGDIGGLIGYGGGLAEDCSASVDLTRTKVGGEEGGLVGSFGGSISNSSATGQVSTGNYSIAGGLVGYYDVGVISGSFASGAVSGGHKAQLGGLVGFTENEENAAIENSYSTGAVTGGKASVVGGLVGHSDYDRDSNNSMSSSYSAGAVSGKSLAFAGGLIGYDNNAPDGCGCFTDLYWDTTTSGIKKRSRGAGNIANDPGITGLSNKEFRSGLPAGFDPSVWAEDKTINNGLPYLIANPPPK